MSSTTSPPSKWAVVLSLGIVYVVWGSTYAGIMIALEGFPPFVLGATRFLAAGALLLAFSMAVGQPRLSRAQLKRAAVIGVLLLCGGNGGVVWAEQYVSSGLAAVIVATVPLWMVVLDALHPRGERLTLGLVLSMLLGLAGVGLLMAGGIVLGRGSGFWLGVASLLAASFSWALGSIYAARAEKPASYVSYAAVQMIAGGLALAFLAAGRSEWADVALRELLWRPLLAQLYLIFFGSILAFSAYTWLLKSATPALVGTYAYVNPVVAVLLGVVFLDESFDWWMAAGTVLILASVVLIQVTRGRRASDKPLVKSEVSEGEVEERSSSPSLARAYWQD
jgi:drug/metabolite transporter (DMT)-like permease